MSLLSNQYLLLQPLAAPDFAAFYELYSRPELVARYGESPVLPGETPAVFATRIISKCNFIWTIRLCSHPDVVIGNCAMHHWQESVRSVEMGGALLPEYQGQGIMQQAFKLMIDFAVHSLDARVIVGKTRPDNTQAIRMVEKLGFRRVGKAEGVVVLELSLE